MTELETFQKNHSETTRIESHTYTKESLCDVKCEQGQQGPLNDIVKERFRMAANTTNQEQQSCHRPDFSRRAID